MHPWGFHPDHRVRLADRHSGGDTEEVPQPHLLHHVLPKPLHHLALGGHRRGLPGHAAVHGGVEQRAVGSAWTKRQGEEDGVKTKLLEIQPLCWTLRLFGVSDPAAVFIEICQFFLVMVKLTRTKTYSGLMDGDILYIGY